MDCETLLELAYRAQGAYQPPAGVQVLRDGLDQDRGYISIEGGSILVAISGTKSLEDAVIDVGILKKHLDQAHVLKEHSCGAFVHSGFWEEYESIRGQIADACAAHPELPVRLAGHSLGGAIATLAAAAAAEAGRDVELVTLGSPRVGDRDFMRWFEGLGIDHVRIVHAFDLVPRVPKLGYRHVGELLHLDNQGQEIRALRGFFRILLHPASILISDLDGEALEDHHVDSYVWIVEQYVRFLKGGDQ